MPFGCYLDGYTAMSQFSYLFSYNSFFSIFEGPQREDQPKLKRISGDAISNASISITNCSINIHKCFEACLVLQRNNYTDINAFTTTITGTLARYALERNLSVVGCVCHRRYTKVNNNLTCILSDPKSE